MNVLDQLEFHGLLLLVVDELPVVGLVVTVGDEDYRVVDVDRFDCSKNYMVVVERETQA